MDSNKYMGRVSLIVISNLKIYSYLPTDKSKFVTLAAAKSSIVRVKIHPISSLGTTEHQN